MNAPRALPMWSGPVGLADTNSTLTERGRVGGDATPGGRIGEDRGDRRLERPVAQSDVEEPGRRHVGARDRRRGRVGRGFVCHLGRQRLRDGERRHAVRPGKLHREVAGEVAVDRVGGAFDLDRRPRRVSRGSAGSAPEATARSQARATAARAWARIGGRATDPGASDIGIRCSYVKRPSRGLPAASLGGAHRGASGGRPRR